MRQIALAIIIFFLFTFFFSPNAFAQENKFSTQYNVIYKVEESGNTTVTQNIQLTNLTSEFYAQEYVLKLSNASIYNLRAFDRRGPINVKDSSEGGQTEVRFTFNDRIAGLGKSLQWTLTYDTSEIAHQVGKTWEVAIPPPDIDQNTTSYTVGIYVPPSFGSAVLQKPKPNAPNSTWSLSSSANTGIALVYSTKVSENPSQLYDFSLKYHLQNKGLTNKKSEIALPPDTSYQKIFLRSISPRPENVTVDEDGNWLAVFNLPAFSSIEVLASGSALVFLNPASEKQTPKNLDTYLASSAFWQINDPEIMAKAAELKTPRQIYNFVVSLLKYDKSRISKREGRLGAKKALKNPGSAICMEFTDLFIALARAAGIPAREINGFGHTKDSTRQPLSTGRDVLHAWPQYYEDSSKTWRMVDPTWGNTTDGIDYFTGFDMGHITFAIHGRSSTSPFPAGAYRVSKTGFGVPAPSKDIIVTPSLDNDPSFQTNLEIMLTPLSISPPIPNFGEITIINNGPTAITDSGVTLISEILDKKEISIAVLPPFGTFKEKVFMQAADWNYEGDDIITVTVQNKEKQFSVKQRPIYKSSLFVLSAGLTFFAILAIFLKVSYLRRKR